MVPTLLEGNALDLRLEIASHADDLAEALDRIEAFLEERQATPRLTLAVRLAVEELVTNTIKYGYDETGDEDTGDHSAGDDSRGKRRISIALALGPPARLRLEDDGHYFDPLAHVPVVGTDAQAEERPIGGLGLHLVRAQAASMRYRRIDGINRLDVVFPS